MKELIANSKKVYFNKAAGIFITCLMILTVFSGLGNAFTGNNELQFTFEFQQPSLSHQIIDDQQFTQLSMPGCMGLGKSDGAPVVPVKFVNILIPYGYQVSSIDYTKQSQIVDTSGFNLESHPIAPHQPPVPIGYFPTFDKFLDFIQSIRDYIRLNLLGMNPSDDNRPFGETFDYDTSIYESSQVYPENIIEDQGVHYCRGYRILSLALNPIQYNPEDGSLRYHSMIDVKIQLEPSNNKNELFRNKLNDKEWVEALVINPNLTDTYSKQTFSDKYTGGICDPSDDYDYVIITTTQNGLDHWVTDSTTPYNWTSLMDKHQTDNGLSCTLVTVQEIDAESDYYNTDPLYNDSQAHIREFCKDAYEDWGTEYVLIGADAEWIPRRGLWYSGESPYDPVDSDLYWSNLDYTFNDDGDSLWGESGDPGFDLYSELFIGSLPCDEPQDVSNWMTKSFNYADQYDQDILENAAFYGGDTGWNCQGDDFVDSSAIKGADDWLGPNPSADGPYPTWAGFMFGFETWNQNNIGQEFNMSVMWTAEPPNDGWEGGSESQAINGLKTDINNDQVTMIAAIAHANPSMSMDVGASSWESDYHNTKPFFLHDYGCHCGDMDDADDGVLHSMLFHSDTELAFACVYNTGYGWGNFDTTNSSSSFQQKAFWDYLFDVTNNSGSTMNWQMGKAQAWSKDFMAPTIDWDSGSQTWRGIIESCLLFGDPAQQLKPPVKPDHNIGIQSFDVSTHEPHDTTISIDTILYNNGKNNESNVYVSFRVNGTEVDSDLITFFEKDTLSTITWQYTTPHAGWNYLSVNVTQLTGETILADNEVERMVIYGPDIGVTEINAPDMMGLGNAEEVKGLIKNLGGTEEPHIEVELIANSIVVDSQTISLLSGESQWVTFMFDGTTSGSGVYPIEIHVVPVADETFLSNQIMSQEIIVGNETIILEDDFESDQGWMVENSFDLTTGAWERGDPVGGGDRGDPATDYDESGQCYVTDNRDGDYDIDDGTTWLISPVIALDATKDAIIEYAVWYSNDYGADPNNDLFKTYVSNDDGGTWTVAEVIGPNSLSDWEVHSFLLSDIITPSDACKVKFEASDLNSGSVVEAGIDAFKASIFDYTTPAGPQLSVNPTSKNFGVILINQTDTAVFDIWNSGTGILEYTLNESTSWMDVTPTQGNSSGEHDFITITVNTTGLPPGPYHGDITIQSNGGNHIFTVYLTVVSGDDIPISLNTGWNLITIPVENDWYASDIIANVTDCIMVSWFDAENQTFRTATSSGGYDFPILPGCGYFVYVTSYCLLYPNGTTITDVNITLEVGWNMIGWYHDNNTMASSLMDNITGCIMISWYDTMNETYRTATSSGGYDFTISKGMGLFIYTTVKTYWHGEG